MRSSLAIWKSSCLNIAGRTTLASSTLASIPSHVMQYTLLPRKILNSIDKIQRNFIWGTTEFKKKLHLIRWETITTDKDKGGLGLRKAKSKNLALPTSMAGRLFNNPQVPWANILTQKFLNNNTKTKHSLAWKGILKGWLICNKGILLSIQRKSTLSIWNSRWISNSPHLRSCIEGPLDINEHTKKISDLINNNSWSFEKLSFVQPPNIISSINNITIPINRPYDCLLWEPNSDGTFSTASCCPLIENPTPTI